MPESQGQRDAEEANTDFFGRIACEDSYRDLLDGFYRKHRIELNRFAYSLTGSNDAAEDIVQQAFTNTITVVQQGRKIANLAHWLRRVIRNLAMDYHRKSFARPTECLWDNEHVDGRPGPSSFTELRYDCKAISDTLKVMPKKQRQIFLLTAIRGLNHDEAASALSMTKGSIRQSLFRSRRTIRASVESSRKLLSSDE